MSVLITIITINNFFKISDGDGLSGAQFGNCNDYNYINPSGVFLHVNKWEVIIVKFMVIKITMQNY